jgi:hypothetical protein
VANDVAPHRGPAHRDRLRGEEIMELATWLPAMFVLGLATFASLFACVNACDRI